MRVLPAGGGILYKWGEDGTVRVLLIYRRDVWDLPKGKKDKGESLEECARREVSEEVGIPLPEIVDKIGKTYHEYYQDGEQVGKTTHWYAMQVEEPVSFNPEVEEDIEQVQWFTLKEARSKVGYDNLVELLGQFEQWAREEK